jgi:hypothetical protein
VQLTSALIDGRGAAAGLGLECGRAQPGASFRAAREVRLLAGIRKPPEAWGIGLNHAEHADNRSAGYPDDPASFVKGGSHRYRLRCSHYRPERTERVTAGTGLSVRDGLRPCRARLGAGRAREPGPSRPVRRKAVGELS